MGLGECWAKLMVDSGNLVGDLMYEVFAQDLGIESRPCSRRINTTAAAGDVQVVGRCRPVAL